MFLNYLRFSTYFMTGLIWLIQLVHYPSFKYIDKSQFSNFHQFHSFNISMIVIPMMTFELITHIYWYFQEQSVQSGIQLILVILIWLSTFFLSVPFHNKLSSAMDMETIDLLVKTNWPRTLLWSIKSILFLLK